MREIRVINCTECAGLVYDEYAGEPRRAYAIMCDQCGKLKPTEEIRQKWEESDVFTAFDGTQYITIRRVKVQVSI